MNKNKIEQTTVFTALAATLLLGNLTSNASATQEDVAPAGTRALGTTTKSVRFLNNGTSMAGNFYFPEGFNEGTKYTTILVMHPGGGVKEQTAALYARKLAERGFVTLTFDASHQGESGGLPRLLENPAERVEDIRSAVDFLTTLAWVDKNRIGALGICAGGGYTLSAAQTDHRIKAVGTVSAVDIGAGFRRGWYGTTPVAEQLNTLAAVSQQRIAEANGAEPKYISYVPEMPDANTPRDLAEATEYYRTPRGQHPNSSNRMLLTSADKILAFDAFSQPALLTQPLLLIAGSEAGSRWQSEEFYSKATGKKELFIVKDATHMTLYDLPAHVNPAVEKLEPFYRSNL